MRIQVISVLGVASAALASAGAITPIQLGGPAGLTYNYITQGAGAVCAAGAGHCITGNTGGNSSAPGVGTTGFVEKNYDLRLFQNATNTTAPVPYAGYSQGSGGGTLGQFAMINDGVAANAVNVSSNNFWDALSASTMLIPVGVSNVNDVSTMLSNIWGGANASDTVITFNFGTTSNASVFNNIVSVGLVNSGNATSSPSGQIGSSVDCATAVPCGTSNPGVGSASGRLAPSSTMTVSLSTNNGLTFNPANLIVTTSNLANNMFGGTTNAYTSIGLGSYSGTSGSLSLYSQDFLLNSLVAASAGEYLVSIQLQEKGGSSPLSQTALSAISIDAAASPVPEPSTVFLLMTGLGAIGLARFRRT